MRRLIVAKRNVAVLDFGSNHISVLIGEKSVNDTFAVKGYSKSFYGGFLEGEILEPENLEEVLCKTITTAEGNAHTHITHLYIGAPAEFCICEVCTKVIRFSRRKKISERDVQDLFNKANEFYSNPTHKVLQTSAICFELDNGEQVIDAVGCTSSMLRATISFTLCERRFLGTVLRAIDRLRIPNIEFVCEPLAEALHLIEPAKRDSSAILVDCGYLTTSVSVIVGDGIVFMRSFSLGGGHIAKDIAEYLKLPFPVAEAVKKKLVLTGKPMENENLMIKANSQNIKVDAAACYDIAVTKVRQIGKMIQKCLDGCEINYLEDVPICLTGGGISYLKGVTNLLEQVLGKKIIIVGPEVPQMAEPVNSAILGLLDYALKRSRAESPFWIKIFSN